MKMAFVHQEATNSSPHNSVLVALVVESIIAR